MEVLQRSGFARHPTLRSANCYEARRLQPKENPYIPFDLCEVIPTHSPHQAAYDSPFVQSAQLPAQGRQFARPRGR